MSRRARTAETLRVCPISSERQRTTAISGGPASGKTGLLIDRLVDLLAPESGPAVSPSRLLIMTGRPVAARRLETRLREALAAHRAHEPAPARARRLELAGREIDRAVIAGGREIVGALLARLGRTGADLFELVTDDRRAREALAAGFDHIAVDDVDREDDPRAALAASLVGRGALTLAGTAAAAVDTGGEVMRVELVDREAAPVGCAPSGADLVADIAARGQSRGFDDLAIVAGDDLDGLMAELDAAGIPVDDRAGALLRSPRIRQLVLALCAICDPDDGVAQAALYAPPLVAIGPADLWAARANAASPEVSARVARAEQLISEIRGARHRRTAGETARALLFDSGCARTLAIGPAGTIWLARLEALCEAVDDLADRGLDYDAAAAVMREWIASPPPIDCPAPLGANAARLVRPGELDGTAAVIYAWGAGPEIDSLRQRAGEAVIAWPPVPGQPVVRCAASRPPASGPALLDGELLADAVSRVWARVEPAARASRLSPASLSAAAGGAIRERRFAPGFGDTVRRGLRACLERGVSPASAITAAAMSTGLETYLREATGDLERILERLGSIGATAPGGAIRARYPIAGVGPAGELVSGAVDLVASIDGELWVIDVIADSPPPGAPAADRFARVEIAASLIARALSAARPPRVALLYSADGSLHQLEASRHRALAKVG